MFFLVRLIYSHPKDLTFDEVLSIFATVYHEKEFKISTSSTLIDVVIHNNDLINNCNVIDCPFSDHRFVMVNLKIEKVKYQKKSIIGRMLTSENLLKISREFDFIDFNNYFLSHSVNEKWSFLESDLLALLNKIAPEKNIVIKSQDSFPWIDDDLKYIHFVVFFIYRDITTDFTHSIDDNLEF